jgi:two-component system, sensor histidine kinase and response regulator
MTSPFVPEKNQLTASPTDQVLDHCVLLSVVDGNTDLLRAICGLFLENYPLLLSEIVNAISRSDGNALARAAHTLKGSGGYFLAESALSAITDLERIGLGGDLRVAPERLAELERQMERVKPELSVLAGKSTESE